MQIDHTTITVTVTKNEDETLNVKVSRDGLSTLEALGILEISKVLVIRDANGPNNY